MTRKVIPVLFFLLVLFAVPVFAQQTTSLAGPGISVQIGSANDDPAQLGQTIQIVMLLTVLSLAPSFAIMATSFTRILIVFGFLRKALGTQSAPPSQVLTGLAIFLTAFIMMPVWQEINENAIQPYQAETITSEQAWKAGVLPLRMFMARQVGEQEYALFSELSAAQPETLESAPLNVLVPAFVLS